MPRQPRARRFTWTLNNYTATEYARLKSFVDNDEMRPEALLFLCFGKETGESGTPHLQGYVEVKSKMTFTSLNALLGSTRIHQAESRGSADQNREYCSKEGEYLEWGTPMRQGNRSDLAAVKRKLDDGGTLEDIADEHFSIFLQYRRGLQAYKLMKQSKRTWQPEVIVLVGNTGTGKTRWAYEFDDNLWKSSDPEFKWFDGYEGQSTVLFDDVRKEKIGSLAYMLELLDRYPMSVQTKGGWVNWIPYTIIITSNVMPRQWYDRSDEAMAPFMRRLHFIQEWWETPAEYQ